jgi:hypothetical protein
MARNPQRIATFARLIVGARGKLRKEFRLMPDTSELILPLVIVLCLVAFLAILFGPSLFASYQNWKIRKGLKH